MKYKPKVLTILLILFELYLLFNAWSWNRDRNETWEECQRLNDKVVVIDQNNTETWEGWQTWVNCNEEYVNQFMMYRIQQTFVIVVLALIVLSWRFDHLARHHTN